MQNHPIGIFDSGVGGLSILQEIRKILPLETSIFVADQAFVPYGRKSKDVLIDRVSRIMNFFEEKKVKTVVAACNTATVYTIDEMRRQFPFPIIGTVPVVKTISRLTKTGKTAVFSTPATAKSDYLKNLIEKFANNIEVKCIGGSNLEELVEEGKINAEETVTTLKRILVPLVKSGVDAMALGCTHYPFLKEHIEEIVGENVKVVDSGDAVARRLGEVLRNEGILSDTKKTDTYYTTGDVDKFNEVVTLLMNRNIAGIHIDL